MKDTIEERVLDVAAHILSTGATVRACARRFGVSKTTVHKDMRERLPRLNAALADAVVVTRQTIISLENGRYNASLLLAHKIAKYFGISKYTLYSYIDTKQQEGK